MVSCDGPLFVERSRGGTDNTRGGVVGDDGINDTSASAVPQWAGFGQRIGEDRLGSVEGSVEVLGIQSPEQLSQLLRSRGFPVIQPGHHNLARSQE